MIQILKPLEFQPINFPHFIRPIPSFQDPIFPAQQIRPNSFCVDNYVSTSQEHAYQMVLNVLLPQHILSPEESSKKRMRDAHILGAKVREQVFIRAAWFPADLER